MIEPLGLCPEGCNPAEMMCMASPTRTPETNPPIPGQVCPSIGLAGGPRSEIPDIDAAVEVVGDGGVGGGGAANADGGSSNNNDDDEESSGPPMCSSGVGGAGGAPFILAAVAFFARRRRV